jgi:hypothetical protein
MAAGMVLIVRLAAAAAALGAAATQMSAAALAADGAADCTPGAFWSVASVACASCAVSNVGMLPPTGPLADTDFNPVGDNAPLPTYPGNDPVLCWAECTKKGAACLAWAYGLPTSVRADCPRFPTIAPCYLFVGITPSRPFQSTCWISGFQARNNSFSYGNTTSCSPCTPNASFISASSGCAPSAPLWAGPIDTSFFFSGAAAEGVSAFSVTQPEGISFVVDHLGNENSALHITAGTILQTAHLVSLPTNVEERTIAAYVRCPATSGIGLLAFSNGSALPNNGDPCLLIFDNNGTRMGSGLSTPYCADCLRSQVSTFAGNGTPGFADGPATSAMFSGDVGNIAFDTFGNAFVPDLKNNRIRSITPSGFVSSLAGNGTTSSIDGVGYLATFSQPIGICLSADETTLFTTEFGCNCIRQIVISTRVVTTIAGGGVGFLDGLGSNARFDLPRGVVGDRRGFLYVADANNGAVRQINSNFNVSTLALVDNPASLISNLALDSREDNLFVTDAPLGIVYRVRISDGLLTVFVALSGFPYFASLMGIGEEET